MSRWLTLCVLSAIIPAGSPLQCMQCTDLGGDYCEGIPVRCAPASDVCVSTLVQDEINTLDPESVNVLQRSRSQSPASHIFIRDCGISSDCDKVVILRTPYNRMVTSHQCCGFNFCTPENPRAIPEPSPNGVTCPGCLTFRQHACESYKPVHCRDGENHCFSFSSQPQQDDNVTFAMNGCASQSACSMELETSNKILCKNRGSSMDLSWILTAVSLCIALLY